MSPTPELDGLVGACNEGSDDLFGAEDGDNEDARDRYGEAAVLEPEGVAESADDIVCARFADCEPPDP